MDDAFTLLRQAVDLLPTADVRLAPLQPEQWQHLQPGDVITMHEAQPAAGIAEIIEVLPPRV
ncbi:hypothetical protein ACIRRH_31235 [Kitasatospora sp. NPDC101235]|uniref:hypothetical protein n=1 Tax=Kitasatospora sp. NPDC101235 TaxID=3364101 RepID=UPI003818CD24